MFGITFGKDGPHPWGVFFGCRVEGNDLAYICEPLDHSDDTHVNASLGELATQQAQDHQSQYTIEGMDPELLVGPMVRGAESEKARVLHAPEGRFHVGLAAVGANNLFVAPVVAVGKEKRLAEECFVKFLPYFVFEGPLEPGELTLTHLDGGSEKFLHVPPGKYSLDSVARPLERWLLSFSDFVDVAL